MSLFTRVLILLCIVAGAHIFYKVHLREDQAEALKSGLRTALLRATDPRLQFVSLDTTEITQPDLAGMTKEVEKSVNDFHRAYARRMPFVQNDPDSYTLQRIEITEIRKVSQMVPRETLSGLDMDPDVYLVKVLIITAFWKNDVDAVLLLNRAGAKYRTLLFYGGGQNGPGVGYRVVDTNLGDAAKELLVFDHQSGNQMGQKRTRLFRYFRRQDRFKEVWNELTDYSRSYAPCSYGSEIDFAFSEARTDALVVKTDLDFHDPETGSVAGTNYRESVFEWNGTRYVGALNVPDCTRGWPTASAVD